MKNVFLLLVFILLAGAGTVFFMTEAERSAETEFASGISPLDADYDYYINDMRTTRFGSDGQPVSQLQAERVMHYPDGDRAELEAPAFRTFGDTNDAWQVSADTGTLTPDAQRAEERLELHGDVQLHKPLAGGNFVDVRTTALTVFPDTEEVESSAPVSLQTRDTRLQGIGMRALLAQDYVQLNNGNGTHDPTPLP